MRTSVILGAAALAMAVVPDAEARGRRGGGTIVYASSSRSETMSAQRTARIAPATPAPDPAFLRPILPVRSPVQAPAPAPMRPVGMACAGGRLVGQGVGFCQIN